MRAMRIALQLTLLSALLPGALAASPGQEAFPPAMRIDGGEVPGVEFATWLVELQGGPHLAEFVDEFLIEREAARAGIELSDEEIERTVQEEVGVRLERAFGGDRVAWAAELEQAGMSVAQHLAERRLEARRRLLIDELVRGRRVVTDEAVQTAWEDRHGPGGRALYASRLLVRVRIPEGEAGLTRDETTERGRAAREAALERVRALEARLSDGEPFDALVREASEDYQTRGSGGRLPDPIIARDWPQADLEALRTWKVGEVLPPFLGGGGYNLMRLESAELTPYASVEATLREELEAAPADQLERQQLREALRATAVIELLPEIRREVSPESPRLDRAVALVDGQALLRREFSSWLARNHGRPFARTFMEQEEIERRAREADLEPSPVEVEQRVQADLERQIQLFHRGDRGRWLEELQADGRTLEDFLQVARIRTRHALRAEALLRKERVVTDEDVRREWESRYGEGGRSLDVRLLMRRIPEPPAGSVTGDEELRAYLAREREVVLKLLEDLAERARSGEDFAALVRTYSQDPATRDRGGRGEGRFELHTWPEEVQTRLRGLRRGEVTGPVVMGEAFLLFELAGRVLVPLEEVQEGLRADLEARPPTQIEVAGFVNSLTGHILVEPELHTWR